MAVYRYINIRLRAINKQVNAIACKPTIIARAHDADDAHNVDDVYDVYDLYDVYVAYDAIAVYGVDDLCDAHGVSDV